MDEGCNIVSPAEGIAVACRLVWGTSEPALFMEVNDDLYGE